MLSVRIRMLLSVVSLVALAGTAACGSAPPPPAPPPPPPAPSPSPSSAPAEPAAGPPVLAVKIDNVADARPPVGIGAADMVYIEPVEGGFSRILAIFGANRPPVIGPVRSARETDAEILPQYGHPTLAFSGAAPEVLGRVAAAGVTDANDGNVPAAYTRDGNRTAPHNLFADPAKLPPGAPWPGRNLIHPGPAPAGGTPADHYDVHYPNASVGFVWSPEQGRWLVSMDGDPYAAVDGGRVGAPTVIIQRVKVHDSAIRDAAGNPSPVAETIGSGPVTMLRDGRAFEGTWNRPAPDAAATYTSASGEPMQPAPGPVWIAITP